VCVQYGSPLRNGGLRRFRFIMRASFCVQVETVSRTLDSPRGGEV
jgi:hypothetical protein